MTVDEEEIDGLEKIQFLQSLDIELSEEDETIFDITESTNAGPAQITIEDSDGTLIINYSGSTHLKRTVDNYQLKSSYRQFESTYPALIYNELPQEEIQQQNSLDLQP